MIKTKAVEISERTTAHCATYIMKNFGVTDITFYNATKLGIFNVDAKTTYLR